MDRVLDHYLHTAVAAAVLLSPARDPIAVPPARPGVTIGSLAGDTGALAWFTAEHSVLLAAVARAAGTGRHGHAWRLAWTLTDYLDFGGHWHEKLQVQHVALAATERLGDRAGQARIRRGLGHVYARLGDRRAAHAHYRRALELSRDLGDRAGQAHTHLSLTWLYDMQGSYATAFRHAEAAVDLYRAIGHEPGYANAVNAAGWCHTRLGNYAPALAHGRQALALQQRAGNATGQASAWDSLGLAYHRLGDHQRATGCYRRAVDLWRHLGERYGLADTLTRLAETRLAAGDPRTARLSLHEAVSILDEVGHPDAAAARGRIADLDRACAGAWSGSG